MVRPTLIPFAAAQMIDGFETLARWVESGVKPAS